MRQCGSSLHSGAHQKTMEFLILNFLSPDFVYLCPILLPKIQRRAAPKKGLFCAVSISLFPRHLGLLKLEVRHWARSVTLNCQVHVDLHWLQTWTSEMLLHCAPGKELSPYLQFCQTRLCYKKAII